MSVALIKIAFIKLIFFLIGGLISSHKNEKLPVNFINPHY